jgi:hypothetical protein
MDDTTDLFPDETTIHLFDGVTDALDILIS